MGLRRGLVFGCGGPIGFAWSAVMVQALERLLGWDTRTADVLVGTSAGAVAVAMLGSGRSPVDIVAALEGAPGADPIVASHVAFDPGMLPAIPFPELPALGVALAGVKRESIYTALAGLLPRGRRDASPLYELGDALAGPGGWVEHPNTWLVATDTHTGKRVAFGSPGAPKATVGQAIAASWAVPGWFPPVQIGGRGYLDGGIVSSASADLLVGQNLDEVYVVAPMTTKGGAEAQGLSRIERVLRGQMTAGLNLELAKLRRAGIRVIRIEPGARELAAMGPNFMNVKRRRATLAATKEVAVQTIVAALARSEAD